MYVQELFEMSLAGDPVTCLPRKAQVEVVYALTARNPLGRDYRGLCDYIGFTSSHIQLIEQHEKSCKAWLAFVAWAKTGKSSIRLLIIALKQLGYQSSLKILSDELQGVWPAAPAG